MDTISFCSDPNPLSLNSGSSATKSVHSDEELILASTRPKKRAGRKKFKETRHPVYRGVRKRNTDKWVCELREPCKQTRIWLGTYPTAEMAARAHDVAALALRGQLACINFADSVWRLPVPATNDAKEIRRVAAMAAEAFRPREERERASDEASSSGCSEISTKNVKGYLKERASSSDSSEISIQNAKGNLKEKGVFEYMDEEAMFDMPGLLANMAQGLLISPPPCISADEISWDDMKSDADMSLWSFSF